MDIILKSNLSNSEKRQILDALSATCEGNVIHIRNREVSEDAFNVAVGNAFSDGLSIAGCTVEGQIEELYANENACECLIENIFNEALARA